MPSESIRPGQFNQYWYLSDISLDQSTVRQLNINQRQIPTQWTIRYDDNFDHASESISRTIEQIRQGTEQVEFSVSNDHAIQLADIMADTYMALDNLRRISQAESDTDKSLWLDKLADTLVRIEQIMRVVANPEATTANAADPLLRMISTYLNENSNGEFFDDMTDRQLDRLRDIFAQIILRGGFEMIGRQLPQGTLEETVTTMEGTADLDTLRADLTNLLARTESRAAPIGKPSQMTSALKSLLRWAPRMIQGLEGLARQWHNVDHLQIELRSLNDQPVLTGSINIRPGKEIQLVKYASVQPTMSFSGTTQMTVIPSMAPTGETVISFEPKSDNGGLHLRFDHAIYALVRLFALPLEDSLLNEIRLYSHSPAQGNQLTHATLLLWATGNQPDPRRLVVYQQVKNRQFIRTAFSLRKKYLYKTHTFNYITPGKLFTYTYQKNN